MNNLKDRIINIISIDHKDIKDIGYDNNFIEECGIDSLDFIKLVSHLDEEFNIQIIDEKFSINEINTINKLDKYINNCLS